MASKLPTRSIGVAFDVSNEASVNEGVARVAATLGGVDVLVNVAGILSNNKAFETSAEEWRKVHAVNYDSCFYLSKACMPHMVSNGWGRVINLSSWAYKSGGLTAGTAYSASKAAMVGLTFSLARQFASSGVTVNAVAPCYVFSPMIMEQLPESKRAELLETIPVRRFCMPEEVAHAVLFLASPLSGFITGEVIDMNGGFQSAPAAARPSKRAPLDGRRARIHGAHSLAMCSLSPCAHSLAMCVRNCSGLTRGLT